MHHFVTRTLLLGKKIRFLKSNVYADSNFNASNIFDTMEICSRHG